MSDLKSFIVLIHLAGLALGLGGAWIADIFLAKHIVRQVITKEKYQFVEFASKVVCYGLALLWLSGFAFIAFYYFFTPEFLLNQKVWAKVSIVTVLTFNGGLVHYYVLPVIKQCIGSAILPVVSAQVARRLTVICTVSFISWLFPLVLGVSKSLNFSVPGVVIVLAYVCMLLLSSLVAQLLVNSLLKRAQPECIQQRTIFLRKTYFYDAPEICSFFKQHHDIDISLREVSEIITRNGLEDLDRGTNLSKLSEIKALRAG